MDVNMFFAGDDTYLIYTESDALSEVSTVVAGDTTPNRGVRAINAAANGAELLFGDQSLVEWLRDDDNRWARASVISWIMASPWRQRAPTDTGALGVDTALLQAPMPERDPEAPWWLDYAQENRYQPLDEDQLSP